ncbi:MAG: CHASE2 domain-containing protein [Vicinamibacteraceae bacterium]
MAVHWWRDRLGPIFAGLAVAATVGTTPVARQLDRWLGDLTAGAVAPALADAGGGSIVFDVDDRTLAELTPLAGSWPYGRDVWAHVVDYLRDHQARGIVLDVLFAEPRVGDAQLSAALDRAPGTVVAAATMPFPLTADTAKATSLAGLGWRVPVDAPAMAWADVTPPRPELRRAGGIAVVTVQPDDDGVVRRVALLHRAGDAVLPAIGLAAVARRADAGTVPTVEWTRTMSGGTLRMGDRAFPVDAQGRAELWYPRTLDGLTTIRFDRLARAALTSAADPQLAALIRDRRVVVGATALMLDYSIQTPRGRIAGVDFARLSAALLAQERVLRPAMWPLDVLLFLVAFAVPFAIDTARRDTPARLVLALPLAWIAIGAISVVLLVTLHQRTALVTPLVAALGATGALGMQELVRLRRERLRLVAERVSAERATDLKTRFINHVAHELRTPLSAILGFGRLIGQDGSGAHDRHDYAQVIVRNSTHLLRLVNNLLDDARLATGHLASDPQPASVRQVIRDVVATIDGLPRGEGVAVLTHVEPDVPERLVIDEVRVRQIVLNLVANAAKFTEQGHIRVDVAWRANMLHVAVEDTGSGIEPEACDRVFEEFEFGSPAAARAGGSGLGLSVSRRLARLMGGDLVLASTTVGAGTRFVLNLPAPAVAALVEPLGGAAAVHGVGLAAAGSGPKAVAALVSSMPATPASLPSPNGDTSAAAVAPGTTAPADWRPAILVCDDSPDIRQLLAVVLDRAGAEAILAPSGEDALVLISLRRPDAVLLDLDLPGMSGLAVAEHLRAAAYDGPVIAVTGGGDDMTPATLREQGFTDIVHKPTPGSVLVEVLAGHLPQWTPRRHRARQAR